MRRAERTPAGSDPARSADPDREPPEGGPTSRGEGVPALPHALTRSAEIEAEIAGRRPLIFLDYDGTLSPIVGRPQDAVLEDGMREVLRRLAARHAVAVVSGRALHDLCARVGLDTLWYAGNHGFEIEGPAGSGVRHMVGGEYVEELASVGERLASVLAPIAGAIVESKRYSLSVHYRLVSPDEIAYVIDAVNAAASAHPRLTLRTGKRVLELRPGLEWHKGSAVRWLADHMEGGGAPVFIGDDVTDEDAFRAIAPDGIGILVAEALRPTAARFWLRDVGEVKRLLSWFVEGG